MPPNAVRNRDQFHAVAAGFLGWTLDAFDFFVVVFLFDSLAAQFHVTKADIVATLVWTLLMRPVGALIFGLLTDRYGRRIPLMANVIFFSVIELLCGFAPNYAVFLVLRILYGIGMGGEWGVGTSLVMEATSSRFRGMLSGILQNGYAIGYLLAALAYRFAFPAWGWRPMFWLGGIPAFLALYISAKVPESEAWRRHRAPSTGAVLRAVGDQWKLCALSSVADDVHDVPLARHAGPLSGLFAIAASRERSGCLLHRHLGQYRGHARRDYIWRVVECQRDAGSA